MEKGKFKPSKFAMTAIKAAKASEKILMKHYYSANKVKTTKTDGQLQLQLDILAENKIIEILQKKFPSHNFVSEEAGSIEKKSKYTWVIDPLDGTHNYFFGLPMFGTSIALAKNDKVIMGLINLPYFRQTFVAEKGKGAFMNKHRLSVSPKEELNEAMMLYDSSFHRKKDEMLGCFRKLMDLVFSVRILGSMIIDFVLISRGKADFYVGHSLRPWDIASGCIIVEEAGGKATDFYGRQWNLKSENLVVSNGILHNKILSELQFVCNIKSN